jgi:hypothetical protein
MVIAAKTISHGESHTDAPNHAIVSTGKINSTSASECQANAGGNMHEPDLPEKDHRQEAEGLDHRNPDPDDMPSFGAIILTIIKYIAILIGIVIFLVLFGLFALYLVCAFGGGGHF